MALIILPHTDQIITTTKNAKANPTTAQKIGKELETIAAVLEAVACISCALEVASIF